MPPPSVSMHDTEELRCGWGCFTPNFLQKCHKSGWLLAALSLMSLIQGKCIDIVVVFILNFWRKRSWPFSSIIYFKYVMCLSYTNDYNTLYYN